VEGVDWLNLNGPWQFRFDAHRRGIDEKWFEPNGPDWREQIIVPFCWESLAAWSESEAAGNDNFYSTRVYLHPLEVTRDNHRVAPRYEVGWYRRTIEIPNNRHWRNRRVILTVGAADFATDCWCNGVHCGRREGGYVPLEFDLTDTLTTSGSTRRGVLTLRVEDPMDNREQPVGKQWGWYTPTSGIWQTVFLEPRGAVHIDHFRITTDIDKGKVHFEVFGKGFALAQAGNIEIIPPEAPPHRAAAGAQRVLPVRLTSFSITEEAYDTLLNPIRAKVDLSMQVLSYIDLKLTNPGYTLFMAHQIAKEIMATSNVANSVQNIGVSLKLL